MNPHSPFAGVLLLPDRQPFGTIAPVTLGSGEPVAAIRWHRWTGRARFDVLDATGDGLLAEGRKESYFGKQYVLTTPGGAALASIEFGFWGLGKGVIELRDGVQLTAEGNWTGRKYEFYDANGGQVARLASTSSFLSSRDSLALELGRPVLSIVQAAGLAQCIRAALESQRSSSAAGGASAAVG
jgi:hypothetical protein